MFELRRLCVSCPFRKGQGEMYTLPPSRLKEIREASAFECHKTAYNKDAHAQQCAGLMAVLHNERAPNQIMQVAMSLGGISFENLDPKKQAYGTWEEVLKAHTEA